MSSSLFWRRNEERMPLQRDVDRRSLGAGSVHSLNRYVLFDSYLLHAYRLPTPTVLSKLGSHGGVAQW